MACAAVHAQDELPAAFGAAAAELAAAAAEDAVDAAVDLALLHAPTMAWPTVCALVRKFFTLARSLVIVVSVLSVHVKHT